MSEEKGQRDLIEAVRQARDEWPQDTPPLRLIFVGDGPLRGVLEDAAARQTSPTTIEFLGHQARPEPWIAAADALVLPSRFEGMPNVVLEAMAIGTPVIATRAGGATELERDSPAALWADPGDPASLAAALLTFATDRDAARVRAQVASENIRRYHDVHKAARQIENLCLDAIADCGPAPASRASLRRTE